MPVRFLLGSTKTYAVKVLAYSLAKDPERRERILQGLDKGLSTEELTHWQAVLAWERACIREGDIPYFCMRAGGTGLYGDPSEAPLMEQFAKLSPIEYATWRIERMGPDDLAVQTAYIRASLRHLDEHVATQPAPGDDMEPRAQGTLTVDEAALEVEDALSRLYDERIPLSDGRCLWHFPMIRGKVGSMFGLAEVLPASQCSPEPARSRLRLRANTDETPRSFPRHALRTWRHLPSTSCVLSLRSRRANPAQAL